MWFLMHELQNVMAGKGIGWWYAENVIMNECSWMCSWARNKNHVKWLSRVNPKLWTLSKELNEQIRKWKIEHNESRIGCGNESKTSHIASTWSFEQETSMRNTRKWLLKWKWDEIMCVSVFCRTKNMNQFVWLNMQLHSKDIWEKSDDFAYAWIHHFHWLNPRL